MVDDQKTWLDAPDTRIQECAIGLLERIEAYCAARSWGERYFGKTAAGDMTVVDRLRKTGRIRADTISKIEKYMTENPAAVREADQ